MTSREKLQIAYELAFYPPRLNLAWRRIQTGPLPAGDPLGELLDTALLLHRSLPEGPGASQRALIRLAMYQAKSRAFGTVRLLENLRRRLGRPPLTQHEVPASLVRDIGLPPLSHG